MSGSLTDKTARQSVDAQTGDHDMHEENTKPVEHGDDDLKEQAAAAHKSNPGPQITENLPGVEGSKDELKAKAQELNK